MTKRQSAGDGGGFNDQPERHFGGSAGQALVEWLLLAGMLGGLALFIGRVVPSALRVFVLDQAAGVRTIAP